MARRVLNVALLIAVFTGAAGVREAEAGMGARLGAGLRLPTSPLRIVDAERDIAPVAYVKFCFNYAAQCAVEASGRRVELTEDAWRDLRQVNAEVNQRIQGDRSKGSLEWSLEATSGNCNDFAVQKRKELIDRGLPASALSLSAVRTGRGIGHLVLTVRTDRGDFVLDNLRSDIVSWDATGYRFESVQSLEDPDVWVRPRRGVAQPSNKDEAASEVEAAI